MMMISTIIDDDDADADDDDDTRRSICERLVFLNQRQEITRIMFSLPFGVRAHASGKNTDTSQAKSRVGISAVEMLTTDFCS